MSNAWASWKAATRALFWRLLLWILELMLDNERAAAMQVLLEPANLQELLDAGWVVFFYEIQTDTYVAASNCDYYKIEGSTPARFGSTPNAARPRRLVARANSSEHANYVRATVNCQDAWCVTEEELFRLVRNGFADLL
jgi:hypothetical protein